MKQQRLAFSCLIISIALFVSACSSIEVSGLEQAEQRWTDSGTERYTLQYSLTGQAGTLGPISVQVDGDEVANFASPDEQTNETMARTVASLFSEIRDTAESGDVTNVQFDGELGYPTNIELDPIPSAIDDEYGIDIEQLIPATTEEVNQQSAHFLVFNSALSLDVVTSSDPFTRQLEMTVQLAPGVSISAVDELLGQNGFDHVFLTESDTALSDDRGTHRGPTG